ncbi:MAG: Chromosomal replication initiator protein DnaA [Patescibacteria group bacterium]|nr:Chromosomal replication initiator protein DnaA [Patescibacteria group bacterium]
MINLDPKDLWKSVKGELEIVSNPAHFKAHIPGTAIKKIDEADHLIEISCTSEYQRNFIEERMYGYIKDIIRKIAGDEYRLMFTVEKTTDLKLKPDDFGPLFNTPQENINKAKSVGLNETYSFKRFIVGNHNRLANAVSTAIADNPGKIYNPFFLYSGVGLGKTHLVQAIGQEVLKKNPNAKVLYITGEQFLNEVVDAVRKGKPTSNLTRNELKNKYRNVDVLIVDDIHSIAGKEATQEEFFHTFNALYMDQKQIILTSDRPPHEIKTLEERLSSRFASGMIADIQPPDLETRMAILIERNEELKLGAPREVIEYIAEAIKTNIRELEAKLLQTVTTARSLGQTLNIETTKSIIGQIEKTQQSRITPNTIIREVCKYYGVTIKDLKGTRRMKTLVTPRQISMFFLRDISELGFQAIGELLGSRDHTTVMHGVNKIESSIKDNRSFQKEIDQVRNAILNAD